MFVSIAKPSAVLSKFKVFAIKIMAKVPKRAGLLQWSISFDVDTPAVINSMRHEVSGDCIMQEQRAGKKDL